MWFNLRVRVRSRVLFRVRVRVRVCVGVRVKVRVRVNPRKGGGVTSQIKKAGKVPQKKNWDATRH